MKNNSKKFFEIVKHQLIVSCQAEGDSPFNSPEGVTAFAIAAKMGGTAAIRTEGVEKARMIVREVGLPVIGLVKSIFEDGSVCITRTYREVDQLIEAGCDMVAIDGTARIKEGANGPEFIREVKKTRKCLIIADIATFDEALECKKAGADCVSTTLNGYTPETKNQALDEPNIDLIKQLVKNLGEDYPVFAEGRINTPELAFSALKAGAWAVVVGSAITRPHLITRWFVDAIKR
ncbi:MAG: N-acetylmannosamine-6-phosphate 2-epimerase [Bacteroides sp.]|jgi:N-acylglucosamine-6-phosphate 2-epimerase|nr:N-acetylmannosamine-6-phosphate 2-epimerase [Bacteroides sp.]